MGKPSQGNAWLLNTESIGVQGETLGTETSKYQQEEKSKEIP
jgi:hypothetical protein